MSRLIRESRRLEVIGHYLKIEGRVSDVDSHVGVQVDCRHRHHSALRFTTATIRSASLFDCAGRFRVFVPELSAAAHEPEHPPIAVAETTPVMLASTPPRVVANVLTYLLPEEGVRTGSPSAPERLSVLGD